jgi:hypothetical protein
MKAPKLCDGCTYLLIQTEGDLGPVKGYWCIRNAKHRKSMLKSECCILSANKDPMAGMIAISRYKAECKYRRYVK